MKLIPTTATAVEKLRTTARSAKRAANILHQEALELVAKEAGYECWFHVLWCRKETDNKEIVNELNAEQGSASAPARKDYAAHDSVSVIRHPPKGDVFHHVEVEGIHFFGCLNGGWPYIERRSKAARGNYEGSVQFGVCSIHLTTFRDKGGPEEWAICKYGPSEPRISLLGLSETGVYKLANEFGIGPTGIITRPSMPSLVGVSDNFYTSQAFLGLILWAMEHPRKIKTYEPNTYLGDWAGGAARVGAHKK